jgi:hypothetical protein
MTSSSGMQSEKKKREWKVGNSRKWALWQLQACLLIGNKQLLPILFERMDGFVKYCDHFNNHVRSMH